MREHARFGGALRHSRIGVNCLNAVHSARRGAMSMSERQPEIGPENGNLLGKTVRLVLPAPGEEDARYLVIEDNGDRLLVKFVCNLPIPPVELLRPGDVAVASD